MKKIISTHVMVKESINGYIVLAYETDSDTVYWEAFYSSFFDAVKYIEKQIVVALVVGGSYEQIEFSIVELKTD